MSSELDEELRRAIRESLKGLAEGLMKALPDVLFTPGSCEDRVPFLLETGEDNRLVLKQRSTEPLDVEDALDAVEAQLEEQAAYASEQLARIRRARGVVS